MQHEIYKNTWKKKQQITLRSNMNLGTVYNLQIKQDFHQLRKKKC